MVNPTFVIGIGEAGTKMASSVRSAVSEVGLEDEFEFFAVDTENGTLDEEMPPNRRYHLPKPDIDWDTVHDNFQYINEHVEEGGLEGTQRQRPLGRFYLDDTNNSAKFIDKIEPVIKDFVDGKQGDAYCWVMNSLGGGSGSGLFPLVTSLLRDQIIPDIVSSKRGANINFDFIGVGAIPYISNLSDSPGGVKGEAKYAANAYTALRELRSMQGHTGQSEFSIQVENPPVSLPNLEDLTISTPLFKRYFLLSQQEDVMDIDKLNRITANLVIDSATSPVAQENVTARTESIFSNAIDDTGNFYTFDGGEIRVPVTEIVELTRYQQRISNNEAEIDELETEISTLDDETDYLEAVLNGRKPDSSSKVSNELSQIIGNYSLDDFDENSEYEEDTVRRHVTERLLGVFPKREQLSHVDAEEILTYNYYVALEKKLREERNSHAFVNQVERQWTEIVSYFSEDQLRDRFAGYSDLDDPGSMNKWRVVVKPHLIQAKDKLEQQQNDGGMFGLGFGGFVEGILGSDDSKDPDEIKEKLRSIQRLADDYEKISSAHERIKGDRNRMRGELRNLKSDLETKYDQKTDRRDALQDEIDRTKTKREGKLEEMSSPSNSLIRNAPIDPEYIDEIHGKMSIEPVGAEEGEDSTAGAEATEDTEARVREMIESLQELVDSKIIDKEAFARSRNEIVRKLHRTDGIIEDQQNKFVDNNVLSGLVVLHDQQNEALLDEVNDLPSVEQTMEFLGLLENPNLDDPFTIRFLGLYTGLELINTSELGIIHREYNENPDEVGRRMGKIHSDRSFIEMRFAYPELLGDDDELDQAVLPPAGKERHSG